MNQRERLAEFPKAADFADNLIASVDAFAKNAASFLSVGKEETKASLGVLCSSNWASHTKRDLATHVEAMLGFSPVAAASQVLRRKVSGFFYPWGPVVTLHLQRGGRTYGRLLKLVHPSLGGLSHVIVS